MIFSLTFSLFKGIPLDIQAIWPFEALFEIQIPWGEVSSYQLIPNLLIWTCLYLNELETEYDPV